MERQRNFKSRLQQRKVIGTGGAVKGQAPLRAALLSGASSYQSPFPHSESHSPGRVDPDTYAGLSKKYRQLPSSLFVQIRDTFFCSQKRDPIFHAKGSSGASLRLAYVDVWVQGFHFVKKVGSLKQFRRSTTPLYKGARVAVIVTAAS